METYVTNCKFVIFSVLCVCIYALTWLNRPADMVLIFSMQVDRALGLDVIQGQGKSSNAKKMLL